MAYRISVDTGGTFTDVVVALPGGELRIGKALTSAERAFAGIGEGLEQVAGEIGSTVDAILAETEVLTYGTTRATNAIVEGATARTAFLTTEGFPDVLLLREGGKPDPFRQLPYPPPYVPRQLTWEIRERVDSEGDVFVPLDEGQARQALVEVADAGCEAVAVCLIWSVVNPAHELRLGELIEDALPGTPYTLSHRLNPVVREYRRASSTAIDASLKPVMQGYLSTMERDLRDAGFAGQLLVATSFGGSWRPAEVVERPIYAVGSGPSLAPVAALTYGRAELGEEADAGLIVCDTGGTTFDVGLISGGEITTTGETWLGGRWIGHITGIRSVDVKSIGAGGGSIVWIDPGGLLRVGPQSAGANPGPACYGLGGERPTVTDAAVVLGYLDPEYFLGGRLRLDASAARQAIADALAGPLGMSVEEAAHAAMVIATENIVGAIKEITIAQGIDPREVAIVAGGGASGLNVVPIARELGSRQVLVPSTAGALSACGGMYSDVVGEFSVSRYAETHRLDYDAVDEALTLAEARADEFLSRLTDVGPVVTRKDFFVDARYRSQVWELDVALPSARLRTEADVAALEDAFHAAHERVFRVREPGQYLECLLWKVRATAMLEKPSLRSRELPEDGDGAPVEAPAYFSELGVADVPRYDGGALPRGTTIEGPAIVREPTTTVVVHPGSTVTVTPLGNYLIAVEGGARPAGEAERRAVAS